jgi:hypothetical protein
VRLLALIAATALAAAFAAPTGVAADHQSETITIDGHAPLCGIDIQFHFEITDIANLGTNPAQTNDTGHLGEALSLTNPATGTTLTGHIEDNVRTFDIQNDLDATGTGTITATSSESGGAFLFAVPGVGLVGANVGHRTIVITGTYVDGSLVLLTSTVLSQAGLWNTDTFDALCPYLTA